MPDNQEKKTPIQFFITDELSLFIEEQAKAYANGVGVSKSKWLTIKLTEMMNADNK